MLFNCFSVTFSIMAVDVGSGQRCLIVYFIKMLLLGPTSATVPAIATATITATVSANATASAAATGTSTAPGSAC